MIAMSMPPARSGSSTPLYKDGRVERDLVVVIDTDTVPGDPDAIGVNDLAYGLSTHGHIKRYLYSDDGPPATTPVMESPIGNAAIGWLEAEPESSVGITSHQLHYSDGNNLTGGAIVGGLVEHFAARLAGGGETGTADKDSLAVVAASEIHADILITLRPSLLAARPLRTPESITIASPAEAVALLGLYIRSRGDYLPTKGARFSIKYNKGRYWQHAVLLHVPNLLDVIGRSALLDHALGSSNLQLLSFATLRRLTRVFERRDAIWRLIDQKQDSDVAEDTLAAFDSMLTFLMSASDALAKLADGILGTTITPAYVGWQKDKWRKEISAKDTALGAIVGTGTKATSALEVLRLLRNCIHDEGLDSIAVQQVDRVQETWIVLPAAQAALITVAMEELRPLDQWGVRDGPDGSRYVEIGRLMETLLIDVLEALNAISVRLGDILQTMTPTPPPLPKSDLNKELVALHIQWQVGLGEPWPELAKSP